MWTEYQVPTKEIASRRQLLLTVDNLCHTKPYFALYVSVTKAQMRERTQWRDF